MEEYSLGLGTAVTDQEAVSAGIPPLPSGEAPNASMEAQPSQPDFTEAHDTVTGGNDGVAEIQDHAVLAHEYNQQEVEPNLGEPNQMEGAPSITESALEVGMPNEAMPPAESMPPQPGAETVSQAGVGEFDVKGMMGQITQCTNLTELEKLENMLVACNNAIMAQKQTLSANIAPVSDVAPCPCS